ncbi:hypothetical protein GE21DRAFT_1134650 [Neurospora crassa]|nr:hypothetical protein GE21DRAFT_1134650 [Neurospora crassa]
MACMRCSFLLIPFSSHTETEARLPSGSGENQVTLSFCIQCKIKPRVISTLMCVLHYGMYWSRTRVETRSQLELHHCNGVQVKYLLAPVTLEKGRMEKHGENSNHQLIGKIFSFEKIFNTSLGISRSKEIRARATT